MQKGLELELVGTMMIALVGVGILLMFVSGTVRESVNDGFCYLTQKIGINPAWCAPSGLTDGAVDINPRTTQDLALNLATYSIKCWQEAVKPAQKRDVVCSELFLQNHPGRLTEEDFTKVMEEEGGCQILQNYMVVDEYGASGEYSGDCGDQEQIDWKVFGNVIENQSILRIKYDTTANKIVIQG
jgi:hypothetical protein